MLVFCRQMSRHDMTFNLFSQGKFYDICGFSFRILSISFKFQEKYLWKTWIYPKISSFAPNLQVSTIFIPPPNITSTSHQFHPFSPKIASFSPKISKKWDNLDMFYYLQANVSTWHDIWIYLFEANVMWNVTTSVEGATIIACRTYDCTPCITHAHDYMHDDSDSSP